MNRLKLMRKVKHKTQKEIADYVGITQNAYSYWENDKVRIDHTSLQKLASYYGVSMDFLSGKKYEVTYPVNTWRSDLQSDYYQGDEFLREYMEYRYGKIRFDDDDAASEDLLPDNVRPVKLKKFRMLGEIACGEPIWAEEDFETYIEASANIQADFCLTAKGDSMTGARIHDGDIVFIKEQPIVENGRIAAVIIDDEATLKRWYYYPEKKKLMLTPENPAYEPLVYIGEELNQVRCLGLAVSFNSKIK